MGIETVLEPQHVTIRAVPLPLRQQNLQNLIPELIGYLAGSKQRFCCREHRPVAGAPRDPASEHSPWNHVAGD